MKQAFTLFELQVTLLLTTIVLAMLFLFTFYFQRNFFHYRNTFTQQREARVFFNWIHQQALNSRLITSSAGELRFVGFDGSEHLLQLDEEQGPTYEAVVFFNDPLKVDIKTDDTDLGTELSVTLTWDRRSEAFKRTYPKPQHLGLMEAAHAL